MQMELKLTMEEVKKIVADHIQSTVAFSVLASCGEVTYSGQYDEREADGIKFGVII